MCKSMNAFFCSFKYKEHESDILTLCPEIQIFIGLYHLQVNGYNNGS